jgi:hypothetical protein
VSRAPDDDYGDYGLNPGDEPIPVEVPEEWDEDFDDDDFDDSDFDDLDDEDDWDDELD